jgi:hypothetical protein
MTENIGLQPIVGSIDTARAPFGGAKPTPSQLDLTKAAFMTSSAGQMGYGIFMSGLNAATMERDEGFSPVAQLKAKGNEDLAKYQAFMFEARSEAEFDSKAEYLRGQIARREMLAEGNWLSGVAEAGFEILNPFNWGGYGYVSKAGSLAQRLSRGTALSAAQGAVATNVASQFDPTITAAESFSAVAGSAAGGMAYEGARAVLKRVRGQPVGEWGTPTDRSALDPLTDDGYRPGSASAAASPVQPGAPKMEAPIATGAGVETLGTSPFVRAVNSEMAGVSEFAQSLFPSMFGLNKNASGIANPESVWSKFKVNWEPRLYEAISDLDAQYAAYRGREGQTSWGSRTALSIMDTIKGTDGSLRREEFSDRVWEQLRTRDMADPIPQVNAVAKTFANFYDKAAEEMVSTGFFKELGPRIFQMANRRIEEHYSGPRVWNRGVLEADKDGFADAWQRYQSDLPSNHGHRKVTADEAYDAVRQNKQFSSIDDDMIGKASALRRRTLDVPSEYFKRYMLTDVDTLTRYYARRTGMDIEIGKMMRQTVGGGPDVTMRERITGAMREFAHAIDDKFDAIGYAPKPDGDGIVRGPGTRAFDVMVRRVDEVRRFNSDVYAKASEIWENGGDVTNLDGPKDILEAAMALANKHGRSKNFQTDIAADLKAVLTKEQEAAQEGYRGAMLRSFAGEDAKAVDDLVNKMIWSERDMLDLRDALRGTLGQSVDPFSITARGSRVLKQFANMTVLSGVTAAASDIGNAVMRFGLDRTFGTMFSEFKNGMKGLKASKADMNKAAVGLEMVLNGRAAAMSDLGDVQGRFTMFERGMEALNSQAFILNLVTPWTNMAQQFTGLMVVDETIRLAKAAATGGKLTQRQTIRLAQSGIDKDMLGRIAAMADKHASDVDGVMIGGVNDWTDAGARNAVRRIVAEDVRRVIVEPHAGEIPVMMSGPLGSLVFQYKAFAVASTNRLLIPALQHKDRQAMTGVLAMVAAGYAVDQLRHFQSMQSDTDRPMSMQIGRAIERSGVLGYYTDFGRTLDTLSDNRFGWGAAFGEPPRKPDYLDLLGPGVSQVRRAGRVAGDVATGEWDEGTARDVRSLLYMNRFAGTHWMFNAIQDSMTPDTLASKAP